VGSKDQITTDVLEVLSAADSELDIPFGCDCVVQGPDTDQPKLLLDKSQTYSKNLAIVLV
jgi:hypothetical protein